MTIKEFLGQYGDKQSRKSHLSDGGLDFDGYTLSYVVDKNSLDTIRMFWMIRDGSNRTGIAIILSDGIVFVFDTMNSYTGFYLDTYRYVVVDLPTIAEKIKKEINQMINNNDLKMVNSKEDLLHKI